jgi:hypothetical protein
MAASLSQLHSGLPIDEVQTWEFKTNISMIFKINQPVEEFCVFVEPKGLQPYSLRPAMGPYI